MKTPDTRQFGVTSSRHRIGTPSCILQRQKLIRTKTAIEKQPLRSLLVMASGSERGFPCLFEECIPMWIASIAAPAMTNIRALAREGKLSKEDVDRVMVLPVTFGSLVEVFLKNRELLLEEYSSDPGVPLHISVLESFQNDFPNLMEMSQVVVVGDEDSSNELVYGIAVNSNEKRITLAFRGSVTKKDYETDFKIMHCKAPNPVQEHAKTVYLHSGFSSYLLQEKQGKAKFDVIVGHLRSLFAKYPGYRLYVTGHSLGGSLAILSAFKLAALDEFPTPITQIAFGPLLVGDLRFRRAFQIMERNKKIRSLCIVNEGDLIPLMPRRGGIHVYRHVGNQLRLSLGKADVSYAPEVKTYIGAWFKDTPNQFVHIFRLGQTLLCDRSFWEHHGVKETTENLLSVADILKKKELNGFYTARRHGAVVYDSL